MSARKGAFFLVVALVLVGCGGDETAAPLTPARGGIENLDNVLQLRSDFEAGASKTRLLVLFSPT